MRVLALLLVGCGGECATYAETYIAFLDGALTGSLRLNVDPEGRITGVFDTTDLEGPVDGTLSCVTGTVGAQIDLGDPTCLGRIDGILGESSGNGTWTACESSEVDGTWLVDYAQ